MLLPRQIDQTYRGRRVALWILGLVVALKITQSAEIIFNTRQTVISADGIPLDSYPPGAAQTVVALFALSSLYRLFLISLCLLALVRYRSAVPFMFALLATHFLAATLLLRFLPLDGAGTAPGSLLNLAIFTLMVTGLILSLWPRPTNVGDGSEAIP